MTKHKLTPSRQRRICVLLADGVSIETAASLSGICERTFHNWIAKAERGEEPFASFQVAASRARKAWKARVIRKIEAASHHDWKAASFLLERSFPREYAPRIPEPQVVYVPQPEPEPITKTSKTIWHQPLEEALTASQTNWLRSLRNRTDENEQPES